MRVLWKILVRTYLQIPLRENAGGTHACAKAAMRNFAQNDAHLTDNVGQNSVGQNDPDLTDSVGQNDANLTDTVGQNDADLTDTVGQNDRG